jgi:Tfp pilus assembly PilM family ATPase
MENLQVLFRGFEGMRQPQVSVGLEVGEEFLRGVVLKRGARGSYSLAHAQEWPLPKEEEKRNTILNEAITILRDKAGNKPAPEWFATVQGTKVCLRLIQIPRVPSSELKGAVMWEARSQVPFPLDRSFTDHRILGEIEAEGGGQQLLALLAAAQQDVILESVEGFQKLGISLSSLNLPAALLWSGCKYLTKPSDEEAFALVNVDQGKIIVCVGKGLILEFTREILFTGAYPASDDPSSSEEHPLVRELRRSFDYYQERHKGEKVKKILLSGGEACESRLAEFLSGALQVPVETVDPFQKLGFVDGGAPVDGQETASRSPAFTIAAAAALATGGINLLPLRLRPRKPLPLQKVLIPAAALPLAFLIYSYWSLTGAEKEYRKLYGTRQVEIAKFKEEEQQRLKLKEREKRLTELLAQVPTGSAESLPWKDLFKQMARLLPQNIALKRMTFGSKEGTDKVKEASQGKQSSTSMKVTLEGLIFGTEAEVLAGLAGLMEALQGAGRFQAIGMSSPLKKNKEFSAPAVDFGLAFEVVIGSERPGQLKEPLAKGAAGQGKS